MTTTAPPPTSVPPVPPASPGAPGAMPPPPEPRRPLVGWRLFVGCATALICAMGIGAVFVLEQVHSLRDALSFNSALSLPTTELAPAGWGQPQTLLLVGNDERALTQYYHVAVPPLANEMLLVRLDPGKPYISMMSIPRELEVTIYPPDGIPYTNRLNSAYTFGIGTLVATLKRVLGIQVNHVIVTTFGKFKRAVNEMGCVYSTVDQRYYHVNEPGGDQYQEINLQPGYQDLCGANALQFVSYRHTDTSLVRDARDQSFLLDVKKQYGPTLVDSIGKFEQIFGQAVQTDSGLHSSTQLLNLIGTLISSAGLTVRQVPFQANLVPPGSTPCSCVTATPQQITESVKAFLKGGSAPATQTTAAVARAVHNRGVAAHLPLVSTGPELSQARSAAAGIRLPYEFPRVQDRGGSSVPVYMRNYLIRAPNRINYPSYVDVFSAGQLGQYYDVQGTTWTWAPIFQDPQQSVEVGGRTYHLFYESQHLSVVSWNQDGAAYWVHNSLTNSVPNGELLAIAEETQPVTGVVSVRQARSHRGLTLKDAAVPNYTPSTAKTDLRQLLGSLGGLLALLAVPVLAIPVLRRRRELRMLRAHLGAASIREAQLASALAAPALASALAAGPVAATSTVAPSRAAAPPPTRVYSHARRRRRVLRSGAAAAVLAAAGLGAYLATSRGGVPPAPARRAPAIPAIPSARVAVLNATTVTGAAGRLARQLHGRGVRIAGIGNLSGWQRSGLWVLYGAGQRDQAKSLARLLPRGSALAPMTVAAGVATRAHSPLVVIFG